MSNPVARQCRAARRGKARRRVGKGGSRPRPSSLSPCLQEAEKALLDKVVMYADRGGGGSIRSFCFCVGAIQRQTDFFLSDALFTSLVSLLDKSVGCRGTPFKERWSTLGPWPLNSSNCRENSSNCRENSSNCRNFSQKSVFDSELFPEDCLLIRYVSQSLF